MAVHQPKPPSKSSEGVMSRIVRHRVEAPYRLFVLPLDTSLPTGPSRLRQQAQISGSDLFPVVTTFDEAPGLLREPASEARLLQESDNGRGKGVRLVRDERVPIVFCRDARDAEGRRNDRNAPRHRLQRLEAGPTPHAHGHDDDACIGELGSDIRHVAERLDSFGTKSLGAGTHQA